MSWRRFRSGLCSAACTGWGDALFELADAVLCAPGPVALGAVVEPRTGVPPLPRQPLQGARPWPDRRRTVCGRLLVEHRPARLAAGVRRRRLDVGSLRRRVQPRAGLLLLGVEALRRSADRRRLVLPVDLPARLGARLAGPRRWTCGGSRRPPTRPPPPSTRSAASSSCSATIGEVPLFVFDAGYDPIAIGHELADDARPGAVPHPRRPRLPRRPAAAPEPATGHRWTSATTRTTVQVLATRDLARTRRPASPPPTPATAPSPSHAWHGLHPKTRRGAATGPATTPADRARHRHPCRGRTPPQAHRPRRRRRCGCGGPDPADPTSTCCWRAYLRRFDIEHTFRFAKNTLGWTTPSLCTPDQADRWTWLVVAALTQLRLARGLVDDLRLPWERPLDTDQAHPRPTSAEGFADFAHTIGTPANPPKPSRAGPGRPKGTRHQPEPATQPSRRPPDQATQV